MNPRRKFFYGMLAILIGAAVLGLTFSFNILREKGFEGAWNWKKGIIERAHPSAGPILDDAERSVRKGVGAPPMPDRKASPIGLNPPQKK